MSKYELVKGNLFYAGGNLVSAVLSFFASVILARLLQPYQFGLFSFVFVITGFFLIFTEFGLTTTLMRFAPKYMKKKQYAKTANLFKTFLKYKIFLGFIVGMSLLSFSNQIANYIFNKPEASFVVLLGGVLLIFNSIFVYFDGLFIGLKNFKLRSLYVSLQNTLKVVFSVLFVLLGLEALGAISGTILSYMLILLFAILLIKKYYKFLFAKVKATLKKKELFLFATWVFIGGVVGTFYGMIDQMIISIMLSVEDIGFYRIALTWTHSILYLVPLSGTVFLPYFSSERGKQTSIIFFNAMKYGAIFIFPITFLLSAFSTPFITFIYKEAYLPAAAALRVIILAAIPMFFIGVLSNYFYGVKRPDIATKVVSVMIVLNIILNYFLILQYGIVGAAIATTLCQFISFAVLLSIALSKKLAFKASVILKPLVASTIAYFSAINFLPNVTDYFTFAIYGTISLLAYLIVLILAKGISKEDIERFKNMVLQYMPFKAILSKFKLSYL